MPVYGIDSHAIPARRSEGRGYSNVISTSLSFKTSVLKGGRDNYPLDSFMFRGQSLCKSIMAYNAMEPQQHAIALQSITSMPAAGSRLTDASMTTLNTRGHAQTANEPQHACPCKKSQCLLQDIQHDK